MGPADRRRLRRACAAVQSWLKILMASILRDAERDRRVSRRSKALWSQYNACERRMLKLWRKGRRDG